MIRTSLVATQKWVAELFLLVADLWEKIWAIYFVQNNFNHSVTPQDRKCCCEINYGHDFIIGENNVGPETPPAEITVLRNIDTEKKIYFLWTNTTVSFVRGQEELPGLRDSVVG